MKNEFFVTLDNVGYSQEWRDIAIGHVYRVIGTDNHTSVVYGRPLNEETRLKIKKVMGVDRISFMTENVRFL